MTDPAAGWTGQTDETMTNTGPPPAAARSGAAPQREKGKEDQELARGHTTGAPESSRTASQIRQRLDTRREPQIGTCAACGHRQEIARTGTAMAHSLAESMWRCEQCRGQLVTTFTFTTSGPTPDDDIACLLDELAALAAARLAHQQELEEIRRRIPCATVDDVIAGIRDLQERVRVTNDHEDMRDQLRAAEAAVTALQTENEKLRTEYQGELRKEMQTIGADIVAADWEKRATAAEVAVTALRHDLQALHDRWTARVLGDRAIAGSADQFPLMCQHYMVRATEREACARDLADRLAREEK